MNVYESIVISISTPKSVPCHNFAIFFLQLAETTSIEDAKKAICDKLGVDAAKHDLMYRNEILICECDLPGVDLLAVRFTLSDYNIMILRVMFIYSSVCLS